jgi:hypothetical protein
MPTIEVGVDLYQGVENLSVVGVVGVGPSIGKAPSLPLLMVVLGGIEGKTSLGAEDSIVVS